MRETAAPASAEIACDATPASRTSAFTADAASGDVRGGGGAEEKDGVEVPVEVGVGQDGSLQVGQSSGRRAIQAARGRMSRMSRMRAISEQYESFMARLLRMLAKAIRRPTEIRPQIRAQAFQASLA
jgi:hypothetical protein